MKNKKTFKSRVLLGEIDGMDICARDIKDRKPLTQFAVLGAATCRWWRYIDAGPHLLNYITYRYNNLLISSIAHIYYLSVGRIFSL